MKISWKKFGLRIAQGILVVITVLMIGIGIGMSYTFGEADQVFEAISILLLTSWVGATTLILNSYINNIINGGK